MNSQSGKQNGLNGNPLDMHWLLKSMASAFVVWDTVFGADGKLEDICFNYFNDAYAKVSGLILDEVLGKGVKEIWPGTEAAWFEIYDEVAKSGEARTFEMAHAPTHGIYSCTAYRPGDSSACICVVFEDITERKRTEEALRESEARWQFALEGAGAGMWDWKVGENELFLSPTLKAQLGYADEEMANHYASWETRVHQEDLPRVLKLLKEYLEGRAPGYNCEYRMRAKNGEYRWINARGKVTQRDANGNPLRMIGIHDDVTARKQAELERESRIIALTRPADSTENLRFEDMVNLADIQKLQDQFAEAFGVAALITTPEGVPITQPSNFSRLCGQLIRTNDVGARRCQHSDALLGRLNPSGPNVQHCFSAGLCNAGASISVGGRHVANWLIGQVKDESHEEDTIVRFARDIGSDEALLVAAFRELPTMPRAQFEKVARLLFVVANQISAMAYQNVQQARLIADLKRIETELLESQSRYRESQRIARLGHWSYDTISQQFLWWSEETFRLLGIDPVAGHPNYKEFISHVHEGDRAKVSETVACCQTDGQPFVVLYRVPLVDGSIRHLEARGSALKNERGEVTYMTGTVMDVTERKLAEENLLTFRALADGSTDAIVMADPESTKLSYANHAAHEMFGCDFSKLEMVGLRGSEFWPAEDREVMEMVIGQGILNGWRGEVRQMRRNGQIFDASATVFAIGGTEGRPTRIVAIIRDITDQKLADQALQIANKKLETIIDFLPDATFVVDEVGRVIAWNQAMECMSGVAREAVMGCDNGCYSLAFYGKRRPMLIDLVLKPGHHKGETLYDQFERHGETLVAEGSTPELYGGRGGYVLAMALPLKDGAGNMIGAIECVRDITESKRAELTLRENEERLRLALEGTSDAIWDWNMVTGEVYCSPRYYDLLGYAPGEFAPSFDGWHERVHPEDQEASLAAVDAVARSTDPDVGSFAIEFRMRAKDDGWRWILVRGKVVARGDEGRPTRMSGSFSDIGARKEAETALRFTQFSVDHASEAIFWFDNLGRFNYVNDEACRMLGYSKEELLEQGVTDVDAIVTSEMLRSLIETQIRDGVVRIESVLRHKDGNLVDVAISSMYSRFGDQDRFIAHIHDITERKRALRALESEKHFSDTIINSLPGIFYLFDEQGRLVRWNRNLGTITGQTEERLAGMHMADFFPEEVKAQVLAKAEEVLRSGTAFIEAPLLAARGEEIPYYLTGLRLQQDDKFYMVGTGIDVSERRRAEDALRLIRFGVDRAADAFFLITPDNRFIDVNESACASLGFNREEMLRMTVMDIDPDLPGESLSHIFQVLRGEGRLHFEARHRRKDGAIFPVEVMANYIEFNGEEYNFCFARDISQRKQAEMALHLTRRAIDDAAMAFEWYDDAGYIIDANRQSCLDLGYTREEMLTKRLCDIDPNFPADSWREIWASIKRDGSIAAETTHRRKDGTLFPVQITGNYVAFEGREYVFSYAQDVTARKAAEQAIRELNATLEARVREEVAKNREKDHLLIQQSRLAAMGEMMGNIAHQWRQPINALSLVLANIQDSYEFDQLEPGYLDEQVKRGGRLIEKMSTTIDDFRNFFRPDRISQPFSLIHAVSDAMTIVDLAYAHANIALVLEPGEDVICFGFPNEYAQVVLNLLSNAKEAIKERNITAGRVSIRIGRDNQAGIMVVQDNGGGIDPDVLPKIFDPYFTTREKGTGIGLYMSRMIVEYMGGHIAIDNAEGGVRVIVSTPLSKALP